MSPAAATKDYSLRITPTVSQANADRLIVNSSIHSGQHPQLLLSLMIINR